MNISSCRPHSPVKPWPAFWMRGWGALMCLLLLGALAPAAAGAGIPPTVNITSPIDGAVSINTNDLIITVTAGDADGTVTRVALFRDGKYLAQALSSPYVFDLVNLAAGTNTYTAVATDNDGLSTTSVPVHVYEQAPLPPYFTPTVAFVGAATNVVLTAPANFSMTAAATVYQGNLDRIDFQAVYAPFGDAAVTAGEGRLNPSTLNLKNLAVGSYVFTAVAHDIYGNAGTSSPITVTVLPPPGGVPTFRFTDLGVLGGSNDSEPAGINAHGDVAGVSTVTSDTASLNAFVWQDGVLRAFPHGRGDTYGTAINDSGAVMGTVVLNGNPAGAFLWTPANGYADLPFTEGHGLNNAGQAVGWSSGGNPSLRIPVRWSTEGTVTLPYGTSGDAFAINDLGQVAGYTQAKAFGPQRATLWDATGAHDLGVLAELGGTQSVARGINAAGQVVGSVNLEAPTIHGFLWEQGTMKDLVPLVGCSGWASGINNHGWIIGRAQTTDGFVQHAVLWLNGAPFDLNTLATNLGSAFLVEATAVNDAGQITGVAFANGFRHAFLLTPTAFQPAHPAPTVVLANPTAGAALAVGEPAALLASAQAADGGQIARVDFYAGNVVVATASDSPYAVSWAPAASGPVCLRAVAIDTFGNAAASASVCLTVSPSTSGYLVADIGGLASTGRHPGGLNSAGHFVGQTTSAAFVYAGGNVTYLENPNPQASDATAINDLDQVVVSTPNQGTAIYQNGVLTPLRNFPGSGSSSLGRDINNAGLVVGQSVTDSHQTHAALFLADSVVDLGATFGQYSQANAINDQGLVVGWYQSAPGQPVGMFLYDAVHGLQPLPSALAGIAGQPHDINNAGAIVGNMTAGDSNQHAFLYQNGVVTDLGTLGGPSSLAYAVNSSNQIVGTSESRAFLFQHGSMTDLNTLLPAGNQAVLTAAVAINDKGQILATGHPSVGDSDFRVFLLNPLPKPGDSNQPPTVALQKPAVGAIYHEGDSIPLLASASDVDGNVTLVSFHAGASPIGTITTQPFGVTWANVPAGTYQITARAYDNLGTVSTSAPVTVTVRAFDPAKPAVAVLGAAPAEYNADVRQQLRGTEQFSRVDVIPVGSGSPLPTLAQLGGYGSVLVYSTGNTTIPGEVGDLLADYVESGHGVAVGLNANDTSNPRLQGRFVSRGYLPWSNRLNSSHGHEVMLKDLPEHPLLAGVNSFDTVSANYGDDVTLAPGSVRVASWDTHDPLATVRDIAGGRVVGLNLFPMSDAVTGIGWSTASDGARLLANSLSWAGLAPANRLTVTASGTNGSAHLPGEAITLTATGTGLPVGGGVAFYANGALLAALSGPPAVYQWTNPPVGNYLVTGVYTNGTQAPVVSSGIAASVDSRLDISLVSPADASVVYLPASILMQVSVSDQDAPIAQVDYYLDGAQRIGTVSEPPYSFNFTQFTIGVLNVSAVVTDTLGARRTTPTHHVTVINSALSHLTSWKTDAGDWLQPTNWTVAPPRPQDQAVVNRGTASLTGGGATATNLTVGSTATAALVQTGGSLTVAKEIFVGDSAGSVGSYRLEAPGTLAADQLIIGVLGKGTAVQNGGITSIGQLILGANGGLGGTYELNGGLLEARTELISGLAPGRFRQNGGIHRPKELDIGHNAAVAGTYEMLGGILETDYELIGAHGISGGTRSTLKQMGGTHRVNQELRLGLDGDTGGLGVTGGDLQAALFTMGSDGFLDVTAGVGTNHFRVTGKASLDGVLTVSLPAGYMPLGGDTFTLMAYGSFQGHFGRTNLPPSANGVVWSVEAQAHALVLRALPPPQVVLVSPFAADPQANLFHQVITLSNHGTEPLQGSRIYFPGLPPRWQLYNAAGTENGIPYLEIDAVIPPGSSIQFEVQFLIPDETRPAQPNYIVQLGQVTDAGSEDRPLVLGQPSARADGAVMLPMSTQRNRRYQIEYSDDLVHWTAVEQPVVAAGNKTQWVDDGQPKTASAPSGQPTRYYRAVETE